MPSKPLKSPKILFVSDVHLGAFSSKKNKQLESELIRLIDHAEKNGYRMAILGDLFDYWIEYPGWAPSLGQKLLERFRVFHQHVAPTPYITGNHDNWTLGYFEKLGFDVEPNRRIMRTNDQELLLVHGDATGSSPESLTRPLFHQLIRSHFFMRCYRGLLPPETGLKIMRYFSKLNRWLGFGKTDPEPLNRWSRRLLCESKIDVILSGHDHHPRVMKYDYGTYINLGTFYRHRSLVECNNGRFSLVQWNSKQQQLNSFHPEV